MTNVRMGGPIINKLCCVNIYFLLLCYLSQNFHIVCKKVVDKLRYIRKGH